MDYSFEIFSNVMHALCAPTHLLSSSDLSVILINLLTNTSDTFLTLIGCRRVTGMHIQLEKVEHGACWLASQYLVS